jgi:plastocyanin
MKRRYSSAVALALLAACTAGGVPTPTGGGSGVMIDANLTLSMPSQTPYGESGAYTPAVTTVPVGAQIVFKNTDGFCCHTATLIPNATTFPTGFVFPISATTQRGTTLSGGFSSGAMQPGASSQSITADRSGTYLFGCFFHYNAPMRAAIVVQ